MEKLHISVIVYGWMLSERVFNKLLICALLCSGRMESNTVDIVFIYKMFLLLLLFLKDSQ